MLIREDDDDVLRVISIMIGEGGGNFVITILL